MTFPNFAIVPWSKVVLRRLLPLTGLTLLSLGAVLLTAAYGLKPVEERVRQAEQAYHSAKQSQADLQRMKTLQVQAQAAQRQLDLEWQAIPTREEFTPLALTLSELAKREHVKIPGMSYTIAQSEGGQPVKAAIAFQATGDYAAIYRFLHQLETAKSYLVIERLDVASEQKQHASATKVMVNLTVTTFLRQPAQSGGSS